MKDTKKEGLPSDPLNYEIVAIVPNYWISHLEGQVLTLIETLGLQEKQEKAFKDIFREKLWKWYEGADKRKMLLSRIENESALPSIKDFEQMKEIE